MLPKQVNELEFKRIKLGRSSVDLRFRRNGGKVDVEVLGGDVEVNVQRETETKAA
jgi:hypothetical protein